MWTSHTNKLMADTSGNIGFLLTGQLPIRRSGPAHFPVPGWTGEHEWDLVVPFEEMPREVNPPNHFVSNSNNLIVSHEYPHYVTVHRSFSRAQRVVRMLSERQPFTPEKFAHMHADRFNIPGHRLAQRIASLKPSTKLGQQARDILAAWDGYHERESVGAAVYEVLLWKLYEATLGRLRAWMSDPKPSDDTLKSFLPAVLGLIQRDDRQLLAHDAFPFNDWDAPLTQALDSAAEHLREKLDADPSRWAWGDLHTISFRHGIGREEPVASLLNAGNVPSGGSGDTVNAANHPGGPSFNATSVVTYRQIIDLGDLNNSVFIIPPGQSGHVASPHYADLLEDYLAVRYRPLLWDWQRIAADVESEQMLQPAP